MTFTLVALPLIVMGLLVIEAAQWHITRQLLSFALLEAARAGSTAHGRPQTITHAFETALQPLFPATGTYSRFRARLQKLGLLPWHIEVLQPNATAFTDFTDTTLTVPSAPGRRVIRNDYQAEQHASRQNKGWHEGRGPQSGLTIFEANTLRLRLTYYHQPLIPGIQQVLSGLASLLRQTDSNAAQFGLLTLRINLALTMQTHPVDWWSGVSGGHFKDQPQSIWAKWTAHVPTPGLLPHAKIFNGISDGIAPNINGNPRGLSLQTFPSPSFTLSTVPPRDPLACGVLLCCDPP